MNNPFKKPGILLFIIGIIDIGIMVFCIANQMSYTSSFNIFAVIAGIMLMRGGVKTASVVRWFSAFFIVVLISMIFLFPIFIPLQLIMTQIKLNPAGSLGSLLLSIILTCLLFGVYHQLSTPEALTQIQQAGYKAGKPKSALLAAVGTLVLGGLIIGFLFNSESASRAKAMAKEQLGPDYQYHLSSITVAGIKGSAVVTAYNSHEIKHVQVQW